MAPEVLPKISASLSLQPTRHSFNSSAEAPLLTLTLTSHHSSPITVYADDLCPHLILTCGALTITDLTTGGSEVRQSIRTHCRIPPPSKVAVTLNGDLFHTLLPNTPLTLSTPFSRGRSNGGNINNESGNDGNTNIKTKPLAKHNPGYLFSSSTAKHGACGVDGLEAGHRYALSFARENSKTSRLAWNVVRWWDYGTKEAVNIGLDPRKIKFGHGPHEPIMIDPAGVDVVEFECVE